MTTLITEISILSEIELGLEKISPGVVEAVGKRLAKIQSSETSLGTIHNEYIKRLYVLKEISGNNMVRFKHEANIAETQEEAEEMLIAAGRFDVMEDVIKEIYAGQVRMEFKAFGGTIAVREGWMVVRCQEDDVPPFIKALAVRIAG